MSYPKSSAYKKHTIALAAVIALAGAALADVASAVPARPTLEQIQRVLLRRSLLLDAHLAVMKAALALTDVQSSKWPAFEASVREAAAAKAARWRTARQRMDAAIAPSALERLSLMADHLENNAAELRKVVDAAQPLFDSLTETQKAAFGPLMRDFRPKRQL